MTIYGVDVSKYQPDLSMVSAKREGAEFCIARASYGSSGRDPEYAEHRERAESAGLLFAAYHFVYNSAPPEQEADCCAGAVDDKSVPIWLDLEHSTFGGSPRLDRAEAVAHDLNGLGYRVAGLYLPEWYWLQIGKPSLGGWTVWASSYPSTAEKALTDLYPGDTSDRWHAYGGVEPTIWQFASSVRVPGYTRNTVDGNAFRGTRGALEGLFGVSGPVPAKRRHRNAERIVKAAELGADAAKSPERRKAFKRIARQGRRLL